MKINVSYYRSAFCVPLLRVHRITGVINFKRESRIHLPREGFAREPLCPGAGAIVALALFNPSYEAKRGKGCTHNAEISRKPANRPLFLYDLGSSVERSLKSESALARLQLMHLLDQRTQPFDVEYHRSP